MPENDSDTIERADSTEKLPSDTSTDQTPSPRPVIVSKSRKEGTVTTSSPDLPVSSGSQGSPGEKAAEDGLQDGKRGRGRPPSPPVRAGVTPPTPTPTPPFKRYWSDAPNTSQKPQKLLDWLGELPTWATDRLDVYVGRTWPVLKYITVDEKNATKMAGEEVEQNYIDKVGGQGIFKKIQDLEDRYGAGDYKLIVTDNVVEKRKIAEAYIREGWRDIRAHPPSDRRIDKPESLEMAEKSNQSYIAYLKGKGLLPEQQESRGKEADMEQATALNRMAGLVERVVDRAQAPREDGGKSADVVAEAAKQGFAIMAKAQEMAQATVQASKTEAVDPMANMERMIGFVDKVRPPQQTDSGMMGMFMTQIMEMNKTIMGIQNERIAFAEKMVMEMRSNPQVGAGGGGGVAGAAPGGGDALESGLERVFKIAERLGLKMPGARAAAEAVDTKAGIIEALPDILTAANGLFATGVNAYQAFVYQQAIQRGAVVQMQPPQPMPMPTPAPTPQPNQATPQAIPSGAGPVEGEAAAAGDDGYLDFMRLITRPVLNHINRGLGGDQFAEFLIDLTDVATYEQIKAQGGETFSMALNTFEPIAREIRGKDLVVRKFVDEFMKYDPDNPPDDIGGEGEEEGVTA
jgi:hypothetical protein